MKISSFSSLLFAIAASASPVILETKHQQDLREIDQHLQYIAENTQHKQHPERWDGSCHHPLPRTLPVRGLLTPHETYGKAFFPEVTVLHRCDTVTHCCGGPKINGPLHVDKVLLPLKITYLEDMGDKYKGEWEIIHHYFDNHTMCNCDYHHRQDKPAVHLHGEHGHDHQALQGHQHHEIHKELIKPMHDGSHVYSHKNGYDPDHGHDDRYHLTHTDGFKPGNSHDEHHVTSHTDGFKPVHGQDEHHVTTHTDGFKPGHGHDGHHVIPHTDGFKLVHGQDEHHVTTHTDGLKPSHGHDQHLVIPHTDGFKPGHGHDEHHVTSHSDGLKPDHDHDEQHVTFHTDGFKPNHGHNGHYVIPHTDGFKPGHGHDEHHATTHTDGLKPSYDHDEHHVFSHTDGFKPSHGHDEHHVTSHTDGFKPGHGHDQHHVIPHTDEFKPVHGHDEHHYSIPTEGHVPDDEKHSMYPAHWEASHKQKLHDHSRHILYITENKTSLLHPHGGDFCHHAQPKTIPVHEMLSPNQTHGRAYFPNVTVLHRCDVLTPCCWGHKTNGPLHVSKVILPFKITYLEDMGDKHKGDWEIKYYYLYNHTVCGCNHHHGLLNPPAHHLHEAHDQHAHELQNHHARGEHDLHDHDDHNHHAHGEHDLHAHKRHENHAHEGHELNAHERNDQQAHERHVGNDQHVHERHVGNDQHAHGSNVHHDDERHDNHSHEVHDHEVQTTLGHDHDEHHDSTQSEVSKPDHGETQETHKTLNKTEIETKYLIID